MAQLSASGRAGLMQRVAGYVADVRTGPGPAAALRGILLAVLVLGLAGCVVAGGGSPGSVLTGSAPAPGTPPESGAGADGEGPMARAILERVNPGWNRLGVGVFCAADGSVWATQEFGRTVGADRPAVSSETPPVEPIARPGHDGPTCG